MAETRVYPIACTSAFCGRAECSGCPRKPALDEFKAWRARTDAAPADPIWSPLVYIARRAPEVR